MAFKINSTTVADNSGNIDWARIINAPVGSGDLPGDTERTKSADVYNVSGSGSIVTDTFFGEQIDVTTYHDVYNRVLTNCNCACDCVCYC